MNEPSVFGTESRTLPLDALHYKVTDANSANGGYHVEHRDIHNLYGALQQRTSYEGLLQRDNFQLRPFVLSRSFFMGSQKYGAYWTGDNLAINDELKGSMVQVL
jgi:mannosyl-oligosaccharide alpha-1,3-glucosidase